ncbi:hypothetical protein [Henriciella aquimarina]|uniref:hypothetical protein n=1 Tax=Henriciella aquimarina TaxID=545261 RepID=UPI000A045AE4|nr:hypothetical protein [Henriciella aquimarina]
MRVATREGESLQLRVAEAARKAAPPEEEFFDTIADFVTRVVGWTEIPDLALVAGTSSLCRLRERFDARSGVNLVMEINADLACAPLHNIERTLTEYTQASSLMQARQHRS